MAASRTIKGKIIYSLSMFVMLFIVLSGIAIQQLQDTERFRQTDETVERIDMNTLDILKTDVDFYNFDLINTDFYLSQTTAFLKRHDSLSTTTHDLINSLHAVKKYELNENLREADSLLFLYDSVFQELVLKLRNKGFKDHGLEGSVREFAHLLEGKKLIAANELLMLRRHEKDFLLRDDEHYAKQLNEESALLLAKYNRNSEAVQLLHAYTNAFNALVKLSNEIGYHKQIGLKGELNKITASLLLSLDELNLKGEQQTLSNYHRITNIFIVISVIAVVFCGVLIYFTARHLKD